MNNLPNPDPLERASTQYAWLGVPVISVALFLVFGWIWVLGWLYQSGIGFWPEIVIGLAGFAGVLVLALSLGCWVLVLGLRRIQRVQALSDDDMRRFIKSLHRLRSKDDWLERKIEALLERHVIGHG